MRRISLLIIALLTVALAGPACDSGGGGGGSLSGLDSALVVADVSEADRVAGCEKINAYKDASLASIQEDINHLSCLGGALADIGVENRNDEEACLGSYDPCIAAASPSSILRRRVAASALPVRPLWAR